MPEGSLAGGQEVDGLVDAVGALGIAASEEKVGDPHECPPGCSPTSKGPSGANTMCASRTAATHASTSPVTWRPPCNAANTLQYRLPAIRNAAREARSRGLRRARAAAHSSIRAMADRSQ